MADETRMDHEFRARMEARVDALEEAIAEVRVDVREVLDLMRASKLGAAALKGVIMLGIAVAGAWAAWRGIR